MNILIVGGTGTIGTKLVESLSKKDHHIVLLSRNPKKYSKKFDENVSLVDWNSNNSDLLKDINILPTKKIKYSLRALPNEISNGISTSIIFSAWNAATYVNQINDIDILNAEKEKDYEKIVDPKKMITPS